MIDVLKRLAGHRAFRCSPATDRTACPEPPLALILTMTALGMLVGALAAPAPDRVAGAETALVAESAMFGAVDLAVDRAVDPAIDWAVDSVIELN